MGKNVYDAISNDPSLSWNTWGYVYGHASVPLMYFGGSAHSFAQEVRGNTGAIYQADEIIITASRTTGHETIEIAGQVRSLTGSVVNFVVSMATGDFAAMQNALGSTWNAWSAATNGAWNWFKGLFYDHNSKSGVSDLEDISESENQDGLMSYLADQANLSLDPSWLTLVETRMDEEDVLPVGLVGLELSAQGVIIGTAHDDRLIGDETPDVIVGGAGNDTIEGHGGTDRLSGDEGADLIMGGEGADLVNGGIGDDRLSGDQGDDVIAGGDGRDRAYGGDGDDVLAGQAGDDSLDGGAGRDRLYGGEGTDRLLGGAEADLLDGGDGDDLLWGQDGNDVAAGGAGRDRIYGEAGADLLGGQAGGDILDGGLGDDVLFGDGGDDLLWGQAGSDRLDGGAGFDTAAFAGLRADYLLRFQDGLTIITGPDGTDILVDIEQLRFADGDISMSSAMARMAAEVESAPETRDASGWRGDPRTHDALDWEIV